MPLLSVVAVALLGAGVSIPEGAVSEEARRRITRDLTALEEEWIQVYAKQDLSVLERLIAEDFVATLADGTMRGKREHITAYPADFALYSAVSNTDVRVRVYTPTVAVVTGLYAATLSKPESAEPPGKYRWTDTWLWRKGAWQCVATQETRIP